MRAFPQEQRSPRHSTALQQPSLLALLQGMSVTSDKLSARDSKPENQPSQAVLVRDPECRLSTQRRGDRRNWHWARGRRVPFPRQAEPAWAWLGAPFYDARSAA